MRLLKSLCLLSLILWSFIYAENYNKEMERAWKRGDLYGALLWARTHDKETKRSRFLTNLYERLKNLTDRADEAIEAREFTRAEILLAKMRRLYPSYVELSRLEDKLRIAAMQ
jgi:hypothetical protein